jgi:hypothetical protein
MCNLQHVTFQTYTWLNDHQDGELKCDSLAIVGWLVKHYYHVQQ